MLGCFSLVKTQCLLHKYKISYLKIREQPSLMGVLLYFEEMLFSILKICKTVKKYPCTLYLLYPLKQQCLPF